jgi:hypothetical protein
MVEHVFAHQKGLMGLCVRTIGIAHAKVKIDTAVQDHKLGVIELGHRLRLNWRRHQRRH